MAKITEAFVRERFPERDRKAHKGDFGRILLFAGSPGMAGAAVLAGRAALRSGAGLVSFLLPDFSDPLFTILQTAVPEATCLTPEMAADGGTFDAVCAGSGLGKSRERKEILAELLEDVTGRFVLDADALNLIAKDPCLAVRVRDSKADLVMTPHVGEAKRLLHDDAPICTPEERRLAVTQLAKTYGCSVLLKGADTLVCSPEMELLQNTTGNPGMAAGGSGDVLSGIIAAFCGQGLTAFEAAACGAYIHGRAGDAAAKELGEVCMNAGDLIAYLPRAWCV